MPTYDKLATKTYARVDGAGNVDGDAVLQADGLLHLLAKVFEMGADRLAAALDAHIVDALRHHLERLQQHRTRVVRATATHGGSLTCMPVR